MKLCFPFRTLGYYIITFALKDGSESKPQFSRSDHVLNFTIILIHIFSSQLSEPRLMKIMLSFATSISCSKIWLPVILFELALDFPNYFNSNKFLR